MDKFGSEIEQAIHDYESGKISENEFTLIWNDWLGNVFTPKMWGEVNAGLIGYAEYMRRLNYWVCKKVCAELRMCINRNDWEAFVETTLAYPEVFVTAFTVFDRVPDNLKYQFAIDAYTHRGDSIPAVRKAVRGLRKYGKPELPEDIAAQDTITVYRAGEESIGKAPYRLSWTTDRRVAEFFLNDYFKKHASHLYRAKIRTADIIAYTDDREEREVLQYRKVFDIEDITPVETN